MNRTAFPGAPNGRERVGSHRLVRPHRRAGRGLTLVELMVSMVIGLLIIASMAMLFAGNSRTRAEIERSAQQLESGRLAMELMRDDIHQAGYFGGLAASGAQLVSPCIPRTG